MTRWIRHLFTYLHPTPRLMLFCNLILGHGAIATVMLCWMWWEKNLKTMLERWKLWKMLPERSRTTAAAPKDGQHLMMMKIVTQIFLLLKTVLFPWNKPSMPLLAMIARSSASKTILSLKILIWPMSMGIRWIHSGVQGMVLPCSVRWKNCSLVFAYFA